MLELVELMPTHEYPPSLWTCVKAPDWRKTNSGLPLAPARARGQSITYLSTPKKNMNGRPPLRMYADEGVAGAARARAGPVYHVLVHPKKEKDRPPADAHVRRRGIVGRRNIVQVVYQLLRDVAAHRVCAAIERAHVFHHGVGEEASAALGLVSHIERGVVLARMVGAVPVHDGAVVPAAHHVGDLLRYLDPVVR